MAGPVRTGRRRLRRRLHLPAVPLLPRGEHHLFLSGYWAIPLGAYLALSIGEQQALFWRSPGRTGASAFANRRTLFTLRCARSTAPPTRTTRRMRCSWCSPAVGCSPCEPGPFVPPLPPWRSPWPSPQCSLSPFAPSVLYRQRHGPNPEVAARLAVESEIYGLKPAQLVMPRPDHRLPGLGPCRALRRRESRSPQKAARRSASSVPWASSGCAHRRRERAGVNPGGATARPARQPGGHGRDLSPGRNGRRRIDPHRLLRHAPIPVVGPPLGRHRVPLAGRRRPFR